MNRMLRSGTFRSLAAGILALLVYGGWAYYINSGYGVATGFRAATVQGSYSMALTLSTTLLMEGLYRSLQSPDSMRGLLLTILLTCLMTFSTAFLINWIFGTPRILLTILPGFLIGTVYTISYVYALHRLQGMNPEGESRC